MRRSETIWRGLRVAGLPALWAVTVGWILRDVLADPYVASRHGSATYGHNGEGALLRGLAWTFAELVIVSLILRPWSYRRAWLRAGAALAVCLPWTWVSALAIIHAGGVYRVHLMWLASLVAILGVCVVWSGLASIQAWRMERAARSR